MEIREMNTCNQCHKELSVETKHYFTGRSNVGYIKNYVCINPACPNYALLQMPAEDMPKEEKDNFQK
jgi:predicted secreted protein